MGGDRCGRTAAQEEDERRGDMDSGLQAALWRAHGQFSGGGGCGGGGRHGAGEWGDDVGEQPTGVWCWYGERRPDTEQWSEGGQHNGDGWSNSETKHAAGARHGGGMQVFVRTRPGRTITLDVALQDRIGTYAVCTN